MKKKLSILLLLSFAFFWNCDSSDDAISCFPNSTINVSINLTLPLYSTLNNPNGWAYVGGSGSGTRGLIVVNTGTSFKAYDRNSPQVCPGENTTLEVQADTRIVSPVDGAEWILTSGQPLNDETQGRNLITYAVSSNGNILTITN